MGWPVAEKWGIRSTDLNWYATAATEKYGATDRSVRDFAEPARIGDLVWFRHPDGLYFIAELTGQWQYRREGEHVRADMINFRPARIVKVGLADAGPGKVISSFIPFRCFQPIRAPGMLAFAGAAAGTSVEESVSGDLFDFLSSEDLENVVFVYLQSCGWFILPGTRKRDTLHYEFVLVDRDTGSCPSEVR